MDILCLSNSFNSLNKLKSQADIPLVYSSAAMARIGPGWQWQPKSPAICCCSPGLLGGNWAVNGALMWAANAAGGSLSCYGTTPILKSILENRNKQMGEVAALQAGWVESLCMGLEEMPAADTYVPASGCPVQQVHRAIQLWGQLC